MSSINTVSVAEEMVSLFCLHTSIATTMALEMMNSNYAGVSDRMFIRACNFYVGKNRPALEELCQEAADTPAKKEILAAFRLIRA